MAGPRLSLIHTFQIPSENIWTGACSLIPLSIDSLSPPIHLLSLPCRCLICSKVLHSNVSEKSYFSLLPPPKQIAVQWSILSMFNSSHSPPCIKSLFQLAYHNGFWSFYYCSIRDNSCALLNFPQWCLKAQCFVCQQDLVKQLTVIFSTFVAFCIAIALGRWPVTAVQTQCKDKLRR